ncbi:hypothetical protein [Streptomyces sp. NPDC046985]|uniref:hypothetical protein n=1 Tax=Streptomyces sp. NPDC046985 TaxID=3155377 RepID=UPI0033FC45DE
MPAASPAPAPAAAVPAAPTVPAAEVAHDALLRRPRDLGAPHRAAVLTDEKSTLAERAVRRRL